MITRYRQNAVLFFCGAVVTACGVGSPKPPIDEGSLQSYSSEVVPVAPSDEVIDDLVGLTGRTEEAQEPVGIAERNWETIFPSEFVQEVPPPTAETLAGRVEADNERLKHIMQADMKLEANRIRNLRERLSLDPENTALHFQLGELYYQLQLPNMAEVELLAALGQDDGLGIAHKYLTDIYRQAGSHGRAAFHGRRAHRDLPNDALVLFLWGWSIRDSGDVEAAIPMAEYGVELSPNNAEILIFLALLRSDDERYEETRDLAQRGLAEDSDHLRGHQILAKAYIALGDEAAGEAEMVLHRRLLILNSAKLLRRNPPLPEWERAAVLAHYHQLVGRFDLADAEIARSYELNPDNPAARVIEARIYVAKGDEAKAFEMLESVVSDLPENTQGIRALAELLVNCTDESKRDYERAHPMARSLMDKGGAKDFDVLYTLGKAEAHLGLAREAKKHLRAALVLEPTNGNVLVVLSQLESGEL